MYKSKEELQKEVNKIENNLEQLKAATYQAMGRLNLLKEILSNFDKKEEKK